MNKVTIYDLYFAAFLMASEMLFYDTERSGKKVGFVFEYQPGYAELKRTYFNGTGVISASKYTDAIKRLKTLTYM
jgi:hypothetical protein